MADIQSHTRIINTITGPVERRFLRWMAERLPRWVTPDILTAVGVSGAILVAAGYFLTYYHWGFLWLASLGFVINWYGDSLDGTTARVRHIERPSYGFYIDHVVDAYIIVIIFMGLGLSPLVRFDLACLTLISYMQLSILVYVRTCVRGEFAISYGKLGPTEARLIAVGANTLVYFVGNPELSLLSIHLTVYDWVLIACIFLLLGICIGTTYQQGRKLADEDGHLQRQRTASSGIIPSENKSAVG